MEVVFLPPTVCLSCPRLWAEGQGEGAVSRAGGLLGKVEVLGRGPGSKVEGVEEG